MSRTRDLSIVKSVRALCAQASTMLDAEPLNTRYLRKVQDELDDLVLHADDERLMFLLFFLPSFIDDVYFNLVGDIVGVDSHTVTQARKAVFSAIGQAMRRIVEILDNGELDELPRVYQQLVKTYIEQVALLNNAPFE